MLASDLSIEMKNGKRPDLFDFPLYNKNSQPLCQKKFTNQYRFERVTFREITVCHGLQLEIILRIQYQ